MKKIFYSLIVLLLLSLASVAGNVAAQTRLQYPIPELGYCRDAKECSLYCEIPQNKAACWSYGKYKLGTDVLGVTTMSEEEKEMMRQKAKQYGITFPIADLGGCAGPQECRDFCEQPANQSPCMDFAKKKGFQKEMGRARGIDADKRDELIQKARVELGCTSMESCSRVCESDHSRCETFARKHGVYQEPPESSGRYSAEEKRELMQKAQSELGCTSMESCKSTCEKNPQQCMAFAKKHGFDKTPSPNYGTQRFGNGGCDSEESCKKYCQEHPDECPGFQGYSRAAEGGSIQQQHQGSYTGPSGCRTEAECKSWCNDHPDKCPGFSEGKAREASGKREYELRIETNREMMQKRMEQSPTNIQRYDDYRPSPDGAGGSNDGSSNYPSTSTQPAYQTTQPSSGSYTPPATQQAAP